MNKTKRELMEVLPIIDLVYELVDSRIPFSSRNSDFDNIIKNKPRIIVMTKKDLCDIAVTEKWIKYYEERGAKVVLVNLKDGNDYKKVIKISEDIIATINERQRAKGLKEKEIKALVLGIPNVGKSTFINKMAGKKVANVGNMPGITKNLSWLKTNMNMLLLDTPGLLRPKISKQKVAFNLACMSAIKMEILPIDEVAIYILKMLEKYYPALLNKRYGVSVVNDDDIAETYDIIGKKIGALISGGEVDYDRVSNYILNDMRSEKICGITFDRVDEDD